MGERRKPPITNKDVFTLIRPEGLAGLTSLQAKNLVVNTRGHLKQVRDLKEKGILKKKGE